MKVVSPHFGELFARLDAAGVQFVVLRNYGGLPDHTENDLDVEVRREDRNRFESALLEYAGDAGFLLFRRVDRPHVTMFKLVRKCGDRVERLLIDVQSSGFSWMGLPYLENAEILSEAREFNGFKVPSRLHEFVSRLLLNMLIGSTVPVKYLPELARQVSGMRAEIVTFLSDRFEGIDAQTFVGDIEAATVDRLEPWIGRLKRSLLRTSVRKAPIASMRAFAATVRAELHHYRGRPGVFVVLVGPDGVGKTTVAQTVRNDMRSVFKASRYFHWIRDPLGPWREPEQTSGAVRGQVRHAPSSFERTVGSSLRILRSALRANLGYALRIVPEVFRDRLVIGDRYLYGYLSDPAALRYHGTPELVGKVLRFVPHPDLVFVLQAQPQTVHARKQELPLAEIASVYGRLDRLPDLCANAKTVWIDADQDVEGTAAEVTYHIMTYLYERDGATG